MTTPLDLRPLSIGELLDRSFTLYRRHLALFVGIMAVPSVFGLIFALLVTTFMRGQGLMFQLQPGQPPPDPEKFLPVIAVGAVVYVVMILGYWVLYMLALAATTLAVSELYVGRVMSIRDSYAHVTGHLGRLLLLALLWALWVGVPTMLIFVLLISPAFLFARTTPANVIPVLVAIVTIFAMLASFVLGGFLWLRYALSVPALVLERVTARAAMHRSVSLTRGFLFRVFLLVLLAFVLAYTSAMFLQSPFIVGSMIAGGPMTTTGFMLQMAGTVFGSIGTALTTPIMVIGFAVLYYDLRIRKEALDLQVMLGALDAAAGGQVPLTAPPATPSPALPE